MQFHPLADIFPLLEGDDLEALAEDIRLHGQREPIIVLDGMILDGRNRYRACEIAGVEPITQDYTGPEDKALEYVISLNVHRRHLSTSQRAMAAARMVKSANLHFDQAAKQMNVSVRSVKTARKVLEHGVPELIDRGFSVSDAASITDLAKADQGELIRAVEDGWFKTLRQARNAKGQQRTHQDSSNGELDRFMAEVSSLTQREKLARFKARLEKQAERQLEAQQQKMEKAFETQLYAEVDRRVRDQRQRLSQIREEAEELWERYLQKISSVEAHMTYDEFKLVRGCLHPDRAPEDRREKFNKAFEVFNRLEKTVNTAIPKRLRSGGWENYNRRR